MTFLRTFQPDNSISETSCPPVLSVFLHCRWHNRWKQSLRQNFKGAGGNKNIRFAFTSIEHWFSDHEIWYLHLNDSVFACLNPFRTQRIQAAEQVQLWNICAVKVGFFRSEWQTLFHNLCLLLLQPPVWHRSEVYLCFFAHRPIKSDLVESRCSLVVTTRLPIHCNCIV